MNEAAFPLLGTAFVFAVVLPLSALVARGLLALIVRRSETRALHGTTQNFLVLTGATFVPLAWFLSAGLHRAETSAALLDCLVPHPGVACVEPGLFALALLLVALGLATPEILRERLPSSGTSDDATTVRDRVRALVARRPQLRGLRGRVLVTDAPIAAETRGWLAPNVVVGARFAASMNDEMLAGALAHEHEHLRSFDPARYFVLRLALALNPFGRFLLVREADRWIAAREIHCDREAVLEGTEPLALADAIVRAARPIREAVGGAELGGDAVVVGLRVRLLLAFTESPPSRCCAHRSHALPLALALVTFATLLPHGTSTSVLDAIHFGAESAIAPLLD